MHAKHAEMDRRVQTHRHDQGWRSFRFLESGWSGRLRTFRQAGLERLDEHRGSFRHGFALRRNRFSDLRTWLWPRSVGSRNARWCVLKRTSRVACCRLSGIIRRSVAARPSWTGWGLCERDPVLSRGSAQAGRCAGKVHRFRGRAGRVKWVAGRVFAPSASFGSGHPDQVRAG